MKKAMKKISEVMKLIFGYGIMICLFAGGLTFFGYMAALIVGGDTAVRICEIVSKEITPVIIQTATFFVVFGLVAMYLGGETALTSKKKQNKLKKEK